MMTLAKRLGFFARRFAGLLIVSGVILSIPDAASDGILRYKNSITAFAFVLLLGKYLYDTFFFERTP